MLEFTRLLTLAQSDRHYPPEKGTGMSRNGSILPLLILLSSYSPAGTGVSKVSEKGANMNITNLSCEGLPDPEGIDARHPRLSWQMASAIRGERQSAYRVIVASRPEILSADRGDIWDSGKVDSDSSVNVPFGGTLLESGKAYYWKVRAWDAKGTPTLWSATGVWSMGLFYEGDWKGKWIGLDGIDTAYHLSGTNWIWYPEGNPAESAPVGIRFFRRTLDLPAGSPLTGARFHVTGDNECTLFVNGTEVSRSDNLRLVQDIDVRERLHPGVNVFAASVQNVGGGPNPAGFIGLLELRYADGSQRSLKTDGSWKTSDREFPGWETPGFDDRGWGDAKVLGRAGMQPWGEMYGPEERRLPARWLRKEFNADRRVVGGPPTCAAWVFRSST
jgi:alpha-L-rhamnosidase